MKTRYYTYALFQSSISTKLTSVAWPCTCDHCLSLLDGQHLVADKAKPTHQHQREPCPRCGRPKMIESKLCRSCYKENTQVEHKVCSNCDMDKPLSQFSRNQEFCLQCQKKIDKANARAQKSAERAAASICACGNKKLPESQRCRTCGAALAGAAKLAKLAQLRETQSYQGQHPPIDFPKGTRGRKPRPMRNLGELRIVQGYRLFCILCGEEGWMERERAETIRPVKVRCECGGSCLAEPETRRIWK